MHCGIALLGDISSPVDKDYGIASITLNSKNTYLTSLYNKQCLLLHIEWNKGNVFDTIFVLQTGNVYDTNSYI